MTKRKFTDEQIIKALELHSQEGEPCLGECPYANERYCGSKMAKGALDLINRQRAELKALKMDNDQLQSDIVNATMNLESVQHELDNARAEIERLHSEVKEKTETIVFLKDQATGWSIDFCNLKAKLNTAKAEAIKEFAEGLKEIEIKYALPLLGLQTKDEIERYVDDILMQMRDGIDALVKEMTEGK